MVVAGVTCVLTLASVLGWADDAPLVDTPAHLMEPNVMPGAAPYATDTTPMSAAPVAASPMVTDVGQSVATMAAVAATTAAGRTPGSFGVSTSGAATYRISLWTPPGVGDVKLDLALVYNSRAGNGIMGQGWSLAGLSTITRCNKSWAQDGAPAPVTNTLSDRYCLDGQQLKLVSGSPGVAGAVYATEVESFSKIVANGVAGGGPASFTVTTKAGLVYDYGTTVDSQIYAGSTGTIRTWALSRVHDRVLTTDGNSIAITYANEASNGGYTNGTFRVSEIRYPYTATGQGPFYKVSFSYSARPATDPVVGYLAGSLVQELNQLNSITITNLSTNSTIKSYTLSYAQGTASRRLQLQSVQECSATSCLAPTSVTYQQGLRGWDLTGTGTSVRAGKAETMPLDLNGDGLTDLLYPIKQAPSVMQWWVAFGQPGGFSASVYTGVTLDASARLIPGRFLGNGRMQVMVPQGLSLVLINCVGSTLQLTSTGLTPGGEFAAGDIDGDGLDDLISVPPSTQTSVVVRRNTTVPAAGSSVATFDTTTVTIWTAPTGHAIAGLGSWKVADFNADGRADVAAYTALSAQVFGLTFTFLYMRPLLSNGFSGPFTAGAQQLTSDPATFVLGDWNADGCTDLLHVSKVLISNCAGGFTTIATGATNVVGNAVLPVDWDDDGRTDLVYVYGSASNWWFVVRSTGNGVAAPAGTGIAATNNTAWFAFDKDGDGKQDLGFRDDRDSGNGQISFVLHQAAGAPADLATNFTDGFGMSQSPAYVSIATSNYTKESGANFPELDFQGPLYVVSQVTLSDGTGSTFQNLFQYTGARVHAQGRGFEGFHTQRTYDARNGTYTFDFLQQSFPYTGMHTQRTVQPQATGTVKISEWAATVNKQTLGSAGIEQRTFPFIDVATDTRYEVGGALDGQMVTQTTDRYAYGDNCGNRTQVQRTVTDTDSSSPFSSANWQTTIDTTYATGTSGACLGLPTLTKVTQSAPGQTTQTRTTSYSVDTDKVRIWRQIIEPSKPALKVTTTLGFDGCGNVNSVQIVGSNPNGSAMPARTTGFGYGTRCQLPETLTNALGQSSSVVYDYDFGVPVSVTDPNGIVTSWGYDDLGRRILETRPDQTTTAWSFESCSTGPCWGQNDLRFHVYETSKGSAGDVYDQREQLYDGFDRLRLNQYLRVLGAWVTEATQYDSLGRTVRRDRPTSGASNGYEAMTYDLLNRVTTQKLYQSGGALDRTTLLEYAGRTSSVTDPLGHKRTQVTDVAGRLRRVIDPSPGGTTSYDYDSFGNLNRIQDAIGAVSTGVYNLRGFRTQWTDADRGTWNFSGNSLNELVSWTDARNQPFSMEYDDLGRLKKRTEPEGVSVWNWGSSSAARNIGRLESKSGYGYTESLLYDSKGRAATRKITTDQDYFYDYSYNSIGALDTLTYPTSPVPTGKTGTRFTVKYGYSVGEPISITNVTDGPTTLWTLNTANDYSSPLSESYGNNVGVTSGYRAWTNELTSRQAGKAPSTNNRQNLAFQWDTAGNLTQRQDLNQALTEVFTLDTLDRVSSSTLNGQPNFSAGYDASGNITSRSDVVGTLGYGNSSHPHAVMSAGSHSFTYDANGNQITRDGASQAWASYNLPVQLSQPIGGTTYLSQFSYGPDHQRWKQVASYSNGTETTFYIGGLLEKESPAPSGATQWRHYVYTPSGMAILVTRDSAGGTSTRYLLTDHLGSSDAVLDPTGNTVLRESFAAFGARRGSNWSAATPPDWTGIANTSRHGFTGHEHLDNLLLIHMNGRVYDPGTGRFLSVDPLIGDLGDSQQVNPYAYVGNRPLGFTDPSGEWVQAVQACAQNSACVSIVASIVKTAYNFIVGGSDPPPPPATTMLGQSAQSGMNMCGPGQGSSACVGIVLNAASSPASPDAPYLPSAATAAEIVVSFIPVASTVMGVYDFYVVVTDPNSTAVDVVLASVYILPGGRVVKVTGKVLREGEAVVRAVGKAEQEAARIARAARRGGESAAAAAGRRAHGNYGTALGSKYDTRVTLPSGKKPDAVDWEARQVRELKPDNTAAVRRGERQVEGYRKELEEVTGQPWTSEVDVYRSGGQL